MGGSVLGTICWAYPKGDRGTLGKWNQLDSIGVVSRKGSSSYAVPKGVVSFGGVHGGDDKTWLTCRKRLNKERRREGGGERERGREGERERGREEERKRRNMCGGEDELGRGRVVNHRFRKGKEIHKLRRNALGAVENQERCAGKRGGRRIVHNRTR
eukprot:124805-Hanusia_phi.AAC.1